MKKIVFYLVILLSLFTFHEQIFAADDYKISLTGDTNFDGEITLYVEMSEFVNLTGPCNGVCKLIFNIEYDVNRLALIKTKAVNGFKIDEKASSTTIYKSTGITKKTNLLELTFQNIGLNRGESTKVKIVDATVNLGDKNYFRVKDAEKVIKNSGVAVENPDIDSSNNGTNGNLSSNSYLKSITLDNGTIQFAKDSSYYDILVGENITSLTVNAETEHEKATVKGDGTYTLQNEKTVINLVVTAEDGSERIYTVNVTKSKDSGNTPNDNEQDNNDNTQNPSNDEQNKEETKKTSHMVLYLTIGTILIASIIGIMVIILKQKKNKF